MNFLGEHDWRDSTLSQNDEFQNYFEKNHDVEIFKCGLLQSKKTKKFLQVAGQVSCAIINFCFCFKNETKDISQCIFLCNSAGASSKAFSLL